MTPTKNIQSNEKTLTKSLSSIFHHTGPPPDGCVATVNGKKILKKMDEIWPTDDACVKAQCVFDTNGNPIIKTQREICNTICQAVSQCRIDSRQL